MAASVSATLFKKCVKQTKHLKEQSNLKYLCQLEERRTDK